MRKILTLIAGLALFAGFAIPAQAEDQAWEWGRTSSVVQTDDDPGYHPSYALSGTEQVAAANAALPSDVNGYRFWTGSVCVQPGSNTTGYPIGYEAQQWNLRVGNTAVLALNLESSCSAAGYTPSRSMTIGVYSAPNDPYCIVWLNTDASLYNGMFRWTNHPVALMNYGRAGCTDTANKRYHYTGMAIGQLLGMKVTNSSGFDNRVMNSTSYSINNILVPQNVEGDRVWSIYTGAYGG